MEEYLWFIVGAGVSFLLVYLRRAKGQGSGIAVAGILMSVLPLSYFAIAQDEFQPTVVLLSLTALVGVVALVLAPNGQ